ncbi:hypothetical protein D5125_12000 [Magnetovirga frankeli]|uniref:hypothetical protein n=1 Tax=Magnetovirga frankeli TaxID=947516 RepID=UPI001293796D|nr:hypothetical protein D5125_12000 [gamma proteobacterium SS-5]
MWVLLDTNAYLRLAKRIKPLLGIPFGQKQYTLTILKLVEDEVHRSPRLRFQYPWFDQAELSTERLAKGVRLSAREKAEIEAMVSVLRAHVLENAASYSIHGRSPPSPADCYCLAFGQVRPGIVATDDLGMHHLGAEFEIPVWHGHELLKKMHSAKMISNEQVREIFAALENNDDLPPSWREARKGAFKKVFGRR